MSILSSISIISTLMGGGQQPSATITLRTKIFTLIFIQTYFCNIVKIVIIYLLFSFLSPFSCNLLGWRMFSEALLECQKKFRVATTRAFSYSLLEPFVSSDWTDAKGWGWGAGV